MPACGMGLSSGTVRAAFTGSVTAFSSRPRQFGRRESCGVSVFGRTSEGPRGSAREWVVDRAAYGTEFVDSASPRALPVDCRLSTRYLLGRTPYSRMKAALSA